MVGLSVTPPAAATSSLPTSILLRLILVKEALYRATQAASDQTDIGNIFSVQQLDFTVETLLKTSIAFKGPPSSYNGAQSLYRNTIRSLQSERYSPDAKFPRIFDELVGIYQDQAKGIKPVIAEDSFL